MPSPNNLAFEDSPSDKLLIYIKNNSGPSIEPWETPALISDQPETYPFNKTVFYFSESHIKDLVNC